MQLSRKPGPLLGLGILAALGLAAHPAQAQTTINTLPQQVTGFAFFGVPNTATYGQTITVPTDGNSVLQDFAFNVDNSGGQPIVADAEVYVWTGTASTGPALFQSAPFIIAPNNGRNDYTLYTATPDVALTPGDQYALLFTTSGLQGSQPQGSSEFGLAPSSAYTGGEFVYINNGNDHTQLSSGTGNYAHNNSVNLAFKADFGPAPTVAPEPSSFAAFAFTGLGVAGLILRSRKRKVIASA